MIDLYTWSTPNGRKVSIQPRQLRGPCAHVVLRGDYRHVHRPHLYRIEQIVHCRVAWRRRHADATADADAVAAAQGGVPLVPARCAFDADGVLRLEPGADSETSVRVAPQVAERDDAARVTRAFVAALRQMAAASTASAASAASVD